MFLPPPGIGEQPENVPFHGQRSGPNIGTSSLIHTLELKIYFLQVLKFIFSS